VQNAIIWDRLKAAECKKKVLSKGNRDSRTKKYKIKDKKQNKKYKIKIRIWRTGQIKTLTSPA
jgi:hypothetical protein